MAPVRPGDRTTHAFVPIIAAKNPPMMMSMSVRLAIAVLCGLLIGLERGWSAREAPAGGRVAGIRTFGLLGALGGMAALIPAAIAAVMLTCAGGLLMIAHARQMERQASFSATSAIAALLTMVIGYLAGSGKPVEAAGAAAVMTLLLAMRSPLHTWLEGWNDDEIRAIGRFGIIALVVLPLAPDRPFGPFDAWNPRDLWMVVVLVSGLSFSGYFLSRRAEAHRGLLLMALFGAMASSTAVTVSLARRLRSDGDDAVAMLLGGIGLANGVMLLRVLVLMALFRPDAAMLVAMLLVPAAIPGLVAVGVAMRRSNPRPVGTIRLGNPLDLVTALGLALLMAVLAVVSRWAQFRFGHLGLAAVLSLTGLADVDAAILTLSGLPPQTLAPPVAALIVTGPVFLNVVFKAALCLGFAGMRNGYRAAALLLTSTVIGGAVALWVAR